ncbi:hypothetical protein [Micromonospora endophytica]|uniref:Uncharacterized protein n=1 Tax=Micromonospora endophytica TaxID=515350 RepID=A0A2W2CDM7_9ACTN|nr:hypothetical protein [Micromonospora endophytica]PZF83766.1 hypothetical protein C1I93_29860 [Micromonospora endophytica]RIW40245.1 hypothetical protein D3H59_29630 [Micromonospora endophytica]BCJ61960.1 hypothetical protein Jiend_53820 [Micromonospora endophytica]
MSARTIHAALVLALVAAGALAAPGPAVAAGSAGYCPDSGGVTVVVDFKELGGGTIVRCASGDQDTGLAALKNAGFQVAGTLRWGEGFICRIEGKPTAGTEKCVDTPPASAYWSYWHAPNGGSWTYSDKGVLNRTPPAGSFEGWSFSLNRGTDNPPRPAVAPVRPAPPPRTTPPAPPPRTTPPAPPPRTTAPAPPPAPTPASPPGSAAAPPPVAGGPVVPAGPGGTTPTGPAGATVTAVPPSPATPPTTTTAGAAPLGAASATPAVDATDPFPPTEVTAARDTDGPPFGTLAGLILLVALAGGGIVAARRRRSATPDD